MFNSTTGDNSDTKSNSGAIKMNGISINRQQNKELHNRPRGHSSCGRHGHLRHGKRFFPGIRRF